MAILETWAGAPPDPIAWAGGDERSLHDLVRTVLGQSDAHLLGWRIEPVGHEVGSPTTAGLHRVRGVALARGGLRPWSVFVKLLQSWRHWPLFELMPAELRERGLHEWRFEADLYASDLGDQLPDGMRLPRLHGVHELGDDRLALWLEDVAVAPVRWDVARYERAAERLARFSARLEGAGHPLLASRRAQGSLIRLYYDSRLVVAAVPELHDDAVWSHALVAAAGDADLRRDMLELAGRLPALLDAADGLRPLVVHGDACPQNLLVPADDPDGFVAIDWGMVACDPVGAELAQLLVGLVHTGDVAVEALAELRDAVVPAYGRGLAAEGVPARFDEVRFGCDLALVVRSAFTALPVEHFAGPVTDALAHLVAERMALTRALIELGLALTPPG